METNETLRHELREAERGETIGWTEYRFPTWAPIAMAVWAGAYTLGLYYLDGLPGTLASLAFVAIALGYIWWDKRTQAAYPSSGGPMPREYRVPMIVLFCVPVPIILVAIFVGYYVAGWAAAAFAAVSWGLATWLYNRSYARASRAVRERLA